jgi:imidazolonepropionase-like amidohydrolase
MNGMHEPFILRGVHVLDPAGGFSAPMDVSVVSGKVGACAKNLPVGDSRDVEDFAGQWLMPGIFDLHAHLACFADDTLRYLQMPVTRWTMECLANARRLLELGITFVRDPGGADAGMRDGIAEGLAPGPTLQVAVSILSQTGGHADGFLPGPGLETSNGFLLSEYPGRPPSVADGVDGVRRAVREILRAGADWVKICTTGGLLSPGHDHPDTAEFAPDELEAILSEAQRRGVPVMAHAYGGEGLTAAVNAGVRSIEHGLRLTEEQAALMAKSGCWLVPTLAVMHELSAGAQHGLFSDFVGQKIREIEPIIGEAVAIARSQNVRIALGTDLISQGSNLDELIYLHRAGLPVEEVLLAATLRGAECCGVDDRLGRIAEGFTFDAVIISEDPTHVEVFGDPENIAEVFKGGRRVRRDSTLGSDRDRTRSRPALAGDSA